MLLLRVSPILIQFENDLLTTKDLSVCLESMTSKMQGPKKHAIKPRNASKVKGNFPPNLYKIYHYIHGTMCSVMYYKWICLILQKKEYLSLFDNNFMLDQTASSSAMYFSVSFDGTIVTISMDRSTRFHLDVSSSLGLLQYWRRPKEADTEEGLEAKTSGWKRMLLSMLIVTIDKSKDTEKCITDNEVVQSNIKLLINSP